MTDHHNKKTVAARVGGVFPALQGWLLRQPFFTSWLLPRLPRSVRWGLRRVYFTPLDLLERLQGKHDDMVPPYAARFTGYSGDDFLASGQGLADAVKTVAGLEAHSRVLDIGSGIGRLAIPLTRMLVPPGSYDGIDVVESGVRWCSTKITPRFPHFRFTLADVANTEYNPSGSVSAADYTLPYADASFDIVVLYSVFTHMLPADMERYVAEISRVLKTGGRCFATYIIVDEDAKKSMESGAGLYSFKHHVDHHWLFASTTKSPELGVGYDEPYIRELFTSHGLELRDGIYFGSWSGLPPRSGAVEPIDLWQDLVLGVKRSE